jgi:hypothetical protein
LENPFVESVADLQALKNLGNLEVTNQLGDPDDDGEFEELYTFGARSFSVWQVADDGLDLVFRQRQRLRADLRRTVPGRTPELDRERPQTESVELGRVGDRTFAFVGIERCSGVFVYDVTTPTAPEYIQTVVNRDFSVEFDDMAADAEADPEDDDPGRAGDWAPEGIEFVAAADSPTGTPLLAVGYEVSGTVAVFEVTALPEPES